MYSTRNSGCHGNARSNSDVVGGRAHLVAIRAVRIIAGRPDIPPIFVKDSLFSVLCLSPSLGVHYTVASSLPATMAAEEDVDSAKLAEQAERYEDMAKVK